MSKPFTFICSFRNQNLSATCLSPMNNKEEVVYENRRECSWICSSVDGM
jgi:hypothetical protein